MIPEWLVRLNEEEAALRNKINKLKVFIDYSDEYKDLPCKKRNKLYRQLDYMKKYNDILKERIEDE